MREEGGQARPEAGTLPPCLCAAESPHMACSLQGWGMDWEGGKDGVGYWCGHTATYGDLESGGLDSQPHNPVRCGEVPWCPSAGSSLLLDQPFALQRISDGEMPGGPRRGRERGRSSGKGVWTRTGVYRREVTGGMIINP